MISENSRLTPERALFLVRHWGKELEDGTVVRRADPAHMHVKPTMRVDEAMACWRKITAVMWIEALNRASSTACGAKSTVTKTG